MAAIIMSASPIASCFFQAETNILSNANPPANNSALLNDSSPGLAKSAKKSVGRLSRSGTALNLKSIIERASKHEKTSALIMAKEGSRIVLK
jgi:hypothetical protein